MNLMNVETGKEYRIENIGTNDHEMDSFLFSLGCYSGEPVTVISRRKRSCVIALKDARYNIDSRLAKVIAVH